MQMNIELLRHGETEYNVKRLIQGHMDIPLSEVGLAQAKEVGQDLDTDMFDYIVCSDLKRCRQTLESVILSNKHSKQKEGIQEIESNNIPEILSKLDETEVKAIAIAQNTPNLPKKTKKSKKSKSDQLFEPKFTDFLFWKIIKVFFLYTQAKD